MNLLYIFMLNACMPHTQLFRTQSPPMIGSWRCHELTAGFRNRTVLPTERMPSRLPTVQDRRHAAQYGRQNGECAHVHCSWSMCIQPFAQGLQLHQSHCFSVEFLFGWSDCFFGSVIDFSAMGLPLRQPEWHNSSLLFPCFRVLKLS